MKIIKPAIISGSGSFSRASTGTYIGSDGLIKTAAIDEPRLNYNPSDLSSGPMLLTESAATNLLTYSEQFDNGTWSNNGLTVNANAITAPDGALTGDKFTCNLANTYNTCFLDQPISVVADATTRVFSVFVKQGDSPKVTLNLQYSGGTYIQAVGILVWSTMTYTVTGGTVVPIAPEQFKDGWYRLSIVLTNNGTGTNCGARVYVHDQGTTNALTYSTYFWGAKLEIGSVPTSYTPTTTAAVTRAADINTAAVLSNIPETDYAEWNGGTAYTQGTRVILVSTHKIYECITANTNASPNLNLTGTPVLWLEISSTNRWKMFDDGWGSQSAIATPLTFTLSPMVIINSLALLNVAATSITVSVVDISSTTVYNQTFAMTVTPGISDWYMYFYEGFVFKSDLVITDIPSVASALITVSIINTGSTSKCGNCVVGTYYDLGGTQYGASAGIVDYSLKATDGFGNTSVTKRNYAKRMNTNLMINNDIVDDVFNTLATYRSTPLVWIGAESFYTSLIVYGFYKDFDINIAYPDYSSCSLTIEGLT
jgi:hypothetical protein